MTAIKVLFGGDTRGFEAANEKLQRISRTTAARVESDFRRGARGAGAQVAKIGELNRSAELLFQKMGPLGEVMRFAFQPAVMGAAALALGIRTVLAAFEKWMGAVEAATANAARGFGDVAEALKQIDVARIKADANFKNSVAEFEKQTARKIAAIEGEKKAVLDLIEARERAELATVKNPKLREEIRQRYEEARGAAETRATAQETGVKQAHIENLRQAAAKRFAEGWRAGGGRTPDQVEFQLQKLPKDLAALDAQIAEQERVVKDMSVITTVAGAFPYWNDPKNYLEQVNAFRTSQDSLAAMKRARTKLAAREVPLQRASAAFSAADDTMASADKEQESILLQSIRSGAALPGAPLLRDGIGNALLNEVRGLRQDVKQSPGAFGRGVQY